MSELAERNCLQQVVFKLSSLKFFTRHHTTSLCLGHEHRCFGHFWTKHLIQAKFQVSFFLLWLLGVAESKTQLSSPSSLTGSCQEGDAHSLRAEYATILNPPEMAKFSLKV